jgi:agmatine deiminase
MPAEWEEHEACWSAWPSHADLWGEEDLVAVQKEFVALCRAIAYAPAGKQPEKLRILAPNVERQEQAQKALAGLPVEIFRIGFGDIWLRDTGPIFLETGEGERVSGCFLFNGWGEKFNLRFDDEVSQAIAAASKTRPIPFPWILEGGSVEVDGEGTCLTTEQCLLNRNRNATFSKEKMETELKTALGVKKILWLKEGLLNDHTDGHIDTLARFIAPAKVVCMRASGENDPNAEVLHTIEQTLRGMQDAQGRPLEVTTIPSPGKVVNEEGKTLPASYVNFYISNHSLVVPTYGSRYDEKAVEALQALFPNRRVFGSAAATLLKGGGAFHCITQQEPAGRKQHV